MDEFKRFTNFKEVLKAIFGCLKDNEIDRFVDLNFVKNIPEKSRWVRGAFSSLKLTDEFYGSDTANRIFRDIYGIKPCRVDLCKETVAHFVRIGKMVRQILFSA